MINYCGGCTVCCKWLYVKKERLPWRKTDKLSGDLCEKVCDSGCSIHESRPSICREFKCFWLQLSEKRKDIPKSWRPDRLGVLVSVKKYGSEKELIGISIMETKKGAADLDSTDSNFRKLLDFIFDYIENKNTDTKVFILRYGERKVLPLKRK